MDVNFAMEAYRMIREFHNRFARTDNRAMMEEETICYMAHLRMATAHAQLLELRLQEALKKAQTGP